MESQPPRNMDTPEKAERYSRGLLRDTRRMERTLNWLLNDGWDSVVPGARDEIQMRLANLRERIAEFREARTP